MKQLALVTLMALVGALGFAADLKPYDSKAMVDIMRSNQSLLGATNKAISAGDWNGVADGFTAFAQNARKALAYAAPKGDEKEWTRVWNEFLTASYLGVGAAGAKDAATAKKYLDELVGDRNAGHGQFKG